MAKDPHPEVRRAALKSLRAFHKQASEKLPEPVFDLPETQRLEELETVPAAPAPVRPLRQFWG
jgi:hypothetical protein